LDHQGWYDRKDLVFKTLEDLTVLTAMGPPGGGRTFITNRFIRHFNIVTYTDLDGSTIKTIFNTMLGHFLKRFPEEVTAQLKKVVSQVLLVYDTVKLEMLPTPKKTHYSFNLRDIWRSSRASPAAANSTASPRWTS